MNPRRRCASEMNEHDEFHPDLTEMSEKAGDGSLRTHVHHVTAGGLRV